MKDFLFIFIGGGTGSILRYFVSVLWKYLSKQLYFEGIVFPWPTLIVNVLGCFMIGMFYSNGQKWGFETPTYLLLVTGLCGGFTTFSTFCYEGLTLLESGNYGFYALYVILSIGLGLTATAFPFLLMR